MSKRVGGGRRLETNYESNLESLCSLLGEQGCWIAMTKAAYGANQRSLAPQWHPSGWIGAPVATINPTRRVGRQSETRQSAATWSGWSTLSRLCHGCNEAAERSGVQSRIRQRAAMWGEGRAPRRRGRGLTLVRKDFKYFNFYSIN